MYDKSWKLYCEENDIGLILFDEAEEYKTQSDWKGYLWFKLLLADIIYSKLKDVNKICFVDYDIVINPYAPNIFQKVPQGRFGLVSKRHQLGFCVEEAQRKVTFFRNKYSNNAYPLDSSIFLSVNNLYKYAELEPVSDEACGGLFMVTTKEQARLLKELYLRYKTQPNTACGGEQTHLNHIAQSEFEVTWLNYQFQAIWTYEMAMKYPFLYDPNIENKHVLRCLKACLISNYFIHFAGHWYESKFLSLIPEIFSPEFLDELKQYNKYRKSPVYGVPRGVISPPKDT